MAKVIVSNLPETFPEGTYAVKCDTTSNSSVIYLGEAEEGSLGSDAVWRIRKIDYTSGVIITWADGDANFDNIWNNRTSLTYS